MTLPLELSMPGTALAVVPGGAPKVIGIDPSLTCTGLAGDGWTATIPTKARRAHQRRRDFAHNRMRHILDAVRDHLSGVDLAVIEGLAMSKVMDADRQLAWLNWQIRDLCWSREVPYAVVSPSGLKLYAVGKGRRSTKQVAADDAVGVSVKEPVLEAVRGWFGWFAGGSDEADAVVLHAMGRDWLRSPVVEVPAVQRVALDGATWPDVELMLRLQVAA